MNWALRELGLQPDADARTVKLAYAMRLKITRPEDDLEGFQRLHEAYQAALAQLAQRASKHTLAIQTDAVESGEFFNGSTSSAELASIQADASAFAQDSPAPGHASRHNTPAQATFAFAEFYAALRERAKADGVDVFEQWLRAQQPLYDVALKDQVAEQLVFELRRDSPLPCNYLDAVLRFFTLDTINALSWRLQEDLHHLIESANSARTRASGPDWSQLELDPARKPQPYRESPWRLRLMGIMLLTALMAYIWLLNLDIAGH